MPNVSKIASTIAKGMFQDDWNKAKKDEMAIKGEQQRQLLAANADSRAAAGEGREASKFSEWSSEAETRKKLSALGLSKAEQDVIVATQNAQQEVFTTGNQQNVENRAANQDKRSAEQQKIEQSRLALEARRVAMGEELGALEGMTREEQLKEAQRKNRFGTETYTGAVEAENYSNSEEARDERRRAANLSGLRNAGSEGPIYDSIANDLMAIDAKRKQKRTGSAPPQERASASAGAWKKKPVSGGSR